MCGVNVGTTTNRKLRVVMTQKNGKISYRVRSKKNRKHLIQLTCIGDTKGDVNVFINGRLQNGIVIEGGDIDMYSLLNTQR